MSRILWAILAAVTVNTAMSEASAYGVFGEDRRIIVNSGEAPWRWVGRLRKDGEPICTAFVISRNHVMTASHCITADSDGLPVGRYEFVVDKGGDRNSRASSSIYRVGWVSSSGWTLHSKSLDRQDYAVLRLNYELPEDFGAFVLEEKLPNIKRTPMMNVGYPGIMGGMSFRLADTDCRIHQANRDVLLHDCAMGGGNSGGPILYKKGKQYKVVGVISTESAMRFGNHVITVYGEDFSLEKANVASSIPFRFADIMKMISEIPPFGQ